LAYYKYVHETSDYEKVHSLPIEEVVLPNLSSLEVIKDQALFSGQDGSIFWVTGDLVLAQDEKDGKGQNDSKGKSIRDAFLDTVFTGWTLRCRRLQLRTLCIHS
jgi:hypothetical protein